MHIKSRTPPHQPHVPPFRDLTSTGLELLRKPTEAGAPFSPSPCWKHPSPKSLLGACRAVGRSCALGAQPVPTTHHNRLDGMEEAWGHSHEYIRAGNMGSFLSWAVSTSILRGPLGHSTATRSGKTDTQQKRQLFPSSTQTESQRSCPELRACVSQHEALRKCPASQLPKPQAPSRASRAHPSSTPGQGLGDPPATKEPQGTPHTQRMGQQACI